MGVVGLCARIDANDAVEQAVGFASFDDGVVTTTGDYLVEVVSAPADHGVVVTASVHGIPPHPAFKVVIPAFSSEDVITGSPIKPVILVAADKHIGLLPAEDNPPPVFIPSVRIAEGKVEVAVAILEFDLGGTVVGEGVAPVGQGVGGRDL